jgi:hypothetical protein
LQDRDLFSSLKKGHCGQVIPQKLAHRVIPPRQNPFPYPPNPIYHDQGIDFKINVDRDYKLFYTLSEQHRLYFPNIKNLPTSSQNHIV